MRVDEWLQKAQRKLEVAEISTARLDALVLAEDTLHRDRAQLLAYPDIELTPEQQALLEALLQRRSNHEPLAYIRNKTEFYGREFYIDHRVLEPRSESETMIELLKALPLPDKPTIIDIGTGSGALAITAKLELPAAHVIAVDIDRGCLDVATKNRTLLGADIVVFRSNLLAQLTSEQLDHAVLLCNLPYVPDSFHINLAAMNEPRLAIFGGGDGLDLYRKLFKQLTTHSPRPQYILTESMPPQHATLAVIAQHAGFVLEQDEDFIQLFRMAAGNPGL